MSEVVMPRLSDSMEEGTILNWLKSVGDEVAVGDELVEIETDKANMAYESDVAGTLSEILVEEGETVPIGTPIAVVGEPSGTEERRDTPKTEERRAAGPVAGQGPSSSQAAGEDPRPAPPAAGAGSAGGEARAVAPDREAAASGSAGEAAADRGAGAAPAVGAAGERVKASPVARRLAAERGLEISAIQGSGPGGRIVKADVESAVAGDGVGAGAPAVGEEAAAPAAAPAPAFEGPETAKGQTATEELSKLQQVVARRMAESKATAPHFYLRAVVDMSAAVEARGHLKAAADGGVVPSFNDMVLKASAIALREHPRANGAYRDGRFELYSRVNIGIAVAAENALVVPTVFDVDRKGLRQIATESRALAERVRDGQITPPELSGATFTVSNLGMYGIEGFSAVINPPQAAILAVGAIEQRPAVRDGQIVPAHLMSVDLACDHRILYGAPAAEFLARIKALLEEPLSLAL